jgi:hypothetical protein
LSDWFYLLLALIIFFYEYHQYELKQEIQAGRILHRADIKEFKIERSELISRIQSPSAIEFAQSQAIEKVYMRPTEEPLRSDADEARYVQKRKGNE